MLPSILNIAEKYGLESDPKSYGKKESLFMCPFCNSGKFHLSLNTKENIFKCWYCKEAGGVLHFEALLSNKSFEEIRQKYFGKRRKKLHPAYKLTPDQLKKIGWDGQKREDFQNFIESKDKVFRDWKAYEYQELMKHYALLTLIAYFPVQEKRKRLYAWFLSIAQESEVYNISDIVIKEWNSKRKRDWALEGKEVARAVYKSSMSSNDTGFLNLLSNVLLALEIKKIKKLENRPESVSI